MFKDNAVSQLGETSTASNVPESNTTPVPESWESCGQLQSDVGSLKTLPSGHGYFVPMASQWDSLVAEIPAGKCLGTLDPEIAEDDGDFHLLLNNFRTVLRVDILAVLPPGMYFDTLKDVYLQHSFSVCVLRGILHQIPINFAAGLSYPS